MGKKKRRRRRRGADGIRKRGGVLFWSRVKKSSQSIPVRGQRKMKALPAEHDGCMMSSMAVWGKRNQEPRKEQEREYLWDPDERASKAGNASF